MFGELRLLISSESSKGNGGGDRQRGYPLDVLYSI